MARLLEATRATSPDQPAWLTDCIVEDWVTPFETPDDWHAIDLEQWRDLAAWRRHRDAVQRWCEEHDVDWHGVARGRPRRREAS